MSYKHFCFGGLIGAAAAAFVCLYFLRNPIPWLPGVSGFVFGGMGTIGGINSTGMIKPIVRGGVFLLVGALLVYIWIENPDVAKVQWGFELFISFLLSLLIGELIGAISIRRMWGFSVRR